MVGLLDVNVLVALSWPEHEAFARSHRWFARHAAQGWATLSDHASRVRACRLQLSIFDAHDHAKRSARQSGHHNEALRTSFRAGRHFVGAGYRTVRGSYGRGVVFVREATGAWALRVAASDQRHSLFDACAPIDVAGRYRKTLAGPLPSVSVL